MKLDLRPLARSIARILTRRPKPVAAVTALAVYSYVVGYQAQIADETSLIHTLQIARMVRENPGMASFYSPDLLARLARAERVAPHIIAIMKLERHRGTPEGRAEYLEGLTLKARQTAPTTPLTAAALRGMGRADRMTVNLNFALASAAVTTRGVKSFRPYVAAAYGRTTQAHLNRLSHA